MTLQEKMQEHHKQLLIEKRERNAKIVRTCIMCKRRHTNPHATFTCVKCQGR